MAHARRPTWEPRAGWVRSCKNFRYGARVLRLNPGFAAIAILSLALGTGANTAIFQLVDALRLRTIPVAHPEQLASVRIANRTWTSGSVNGRYAWITNPQWEQIRDHQQVFSSMFAWEGEDFNLAQGGEVRMALGLWVSGDFFRTLEVPAMIGRTLSAQDDTRGCGSPPAVISYEFWQREYGGKADVLGRVISLDDHAFEIAGVTPASFFGVEVGRYFDVAIPLCAEPLTRGENSMLNMKHGYWLAAMGRLKPGVTLARANAQMAAISPAVLEATIPEVYSPAVAKKYLQYKFGAFPASTGFSNLRSGYDAPLWILMAIAGFVLLIACANIANLLLARANAREREITVRLTLGASRMRLVRQLLAESLLLGVAGAFLGAVLAQWISRFLVAFISNSSDRYFVDLAPDWRVLGFMLGIALLTSLLFGLAPAYRATRIAPAAALRAAGRSVMGGREKFSLRRGLVISQVAFSLVLLVGATLFVRSLRNLLTMDAGFRQTGILEADLDFSRLRVPVNQRQQYKLALIDRIKAIPGVEGAADASIVPISGNGWNENLLFNGVKPSNQRAVDFSQVSPGYFQMMAIPMLAGRDFDERDTANSPKVAIVNESCAKKYFSDTSPIGKTFQIDDYVGRARPVYQIVGLVRDSKYRDLRDDFQPQIFVTTSQDDRPDQGAQILIYSNLPAGTVTSAVKTALEQTSPGIEMQFSVMRTNIRDSLLRERLMATLSGFFGALALLLAMIGLFGVVSQSVVQRTSEIGLRMALGAQRLDIVRMILGESSLMLAVGLAIGIGLALALGTTAGALLFNLKPHDPATLALSAAVLAAVAILASYLPARRAARLDPMAALRDE